jgi:hypothetical protein
MIKFLDVDGPLADFVGYAAKWHGRPHPYVGTGFTDYHLENYWGITPKQLFSPFTYGFWANIPKSPEADEIVKLCGDDTCLLTTAQNIPGCVEGKVDWIKKNYTDLPYLVGDVPKAYCAHQNAVLIDDCDKNIEDFIRCGGHGILIPKPWNRLRGHDVLSHLKQELLKCV